MSSAGWLWARHQLRQHWASVVVLALLTALAGGVAMAAVIGARRSQVVVSEALRERRQPDVMSLPSRPGFDWSGIVSLPFVESYGLFAVSQMCIEESGGLRGDDPLCAAPPVEGGWYDSIWRLDVVEGRMATAPDEVVINRRAVERFGFGIGDRLHLAAIGAGRLDEFWSDAPQGIEPWGPTFDVTVVGIFHGGDDAWRLTTGGAGAPGLAMAPSFIPANGHLLDYRVDAFLRLRGGEADIPQLRADMARLVDAEVPIRNVHDARRRVERSTLVESTALWLFAAAVVASAALLVGQGLVRLVRSAGSDASILRALGMATPGLVGARSLPGLAVAGSGALGAAVVAVVASPRFPIGVARSFDRHPGLKLDLPVLAIGTLGIAFLTATTVAATAWLTIRGLTARRAWTPSRLAAAAGRLGLPVPVEIGARMALERRCGADVVPVRPALIGATVGVCAVVAVFTLGTGMNDAIANEERAGQVWDMAVNYEMSEAFLAADPDIAGAGRVVRAQVAIEGVPVPTYSYEPIGAPLDLIVLSGRLPGAPDEIALGPSTAATVDADVGDELAAGSGGTQRLKVVGTALMPEVGGHSSYDEGAWVTETGLQRLRPELLDWGHLFVDVRPGAIPELVELRIEQAGGQVDHARFVASAAAQNLRTTRGLPASLGVFLAILGIAAVAHSLFAVLRRRRRDLAVLRALGLSRRQTRAVVGWHATTLAAVGVALGVPLGMLAGRWAWRWVATTMPLDYVPPVAALAAVAAVPVTLMAANVIALVPARAAAAARPSLALRVE